ncbi:hypothetical protein SPONN_1290 [uncultured Candidatus Thioglobus sp.]|nr:hypothetical protein SPONN_1290 [uncultured Candidatus Thioglobus sp.]
MYLIDSNVFIQAKNRHYDFDFCPAFWDWLLRENENKNVFSIDKVKDEITTGDDELVGWVNNNTSNQFFLSTDVQTTTEFSVINSWIIQQNYQQSAINEFMSVADYYLIAQAKQRDAIIVTHEIPSNSLRKIKIPNVCIGLGINFVTPFMMLKKLHAKFILQ